MNQTYDHKILISKFKIKMLKYSNKKRNQFIIINNNVFLKIKSRTEQIDIKGGNNQSLKSLNQSKKPNMVNLRRIYLDNLDYHQF